MRILVLGQTGSNTVPLPTQCANALASLGHTVSTVNTEDVRNKLPETLKKWSKSIAKLIGKKEFLSNYYRKRESLARLSRIVCEYRKTNPDLVIVFRGNGIDYGFIEKIRSEGKRVVGWWIEGPARASRMLSEVKFYDIYYCIHANLCDNKRVHYLPAWAVDPTYYFSVNKRHYEFDIAFVGGWTEKRQKYIDAISDFDLAIVGPGWKKHMPKSTIARNLFGRDLVGLYHKSRIVINICGWGANDATGTNLRVADIPACGSFLLTEYTGGIEELYEIDREVVTFNSPEELRAKALYYLMNSEIRERIAEAGFLRTKQLPTHKDRVMRIINDIQRLREK